MKLKSNNPFYNHMAAFPAAKPDGCSGNETFSPPFTLLFHHFVALLYRL